jgi:hypothetical protein
MHRDHKIFIQAIKDRKKILVKHRSDKNSDALTKVCCPLFYIPTANKDNCGHYYFWEDENGSKGNITSVKTDDIVRIGPTHESFHRVDFSLISNEDISP